MNGDRYICTNSYTKKKYRQNRWIIPDTPKPKPKSTPLTMHVNSLSSSPLSLNMVHRPHLDLDIMRPHKPLFIQPPLFFQVLELDFVPIEHGSDQLV